MAASVTNTVSTVFTVNDKASAHILRIANAANAAAGAVARMQAALRGAAGFSFANVAPNLRASASAAAALNMQLRNMASINRNIGRLPSMRVTGGTAGGAAGGAGGGGRGGGGGFLTTAASTYYLASSIGGAAKNATMSIVELQSKYEDMRHTFAGQIQALGMAKSFKDADIQAELLMTRIREMAAKLPGDMNYYAQMVQEASTSLFRAGVPNMEGVLDFMGTYGATVYSIAARHKDLGVGARELFAMVGGVARRQMPLFNYLSQYMDKSVQSVEEFNRLNPAQRFEQLRKSLSGFKDATASAGELVSAKLGEFKDRVGEIIRIGSMPMFEKLKESLESFNLYLSENKTKLEAVVRLVSDNLYAALQIASTATKFLAENMDSVLTYAEMFAAIWIGGKLVAGIDAATAAMNAFGVASKAAFGPLSVIAGVMGAIAGKLSSSAASAFKSPEEIAQSPLYRAMLSLTPGGTAEADRYLKTVEYHKRVMGQVAGLGEAETESALRRMYSAAVDTEKDFAGFVKMFAETHGYEVAEFGKPSTDISTPADRSKVNYDFRFSRFDIRQNFAEGFDPDRIAVAFATDLARLGEMKLHSAYSPVTGGLGR